MVHFYEHFLCPPISDIVCLSSCIYKYISVTYLTRLTLSLWHCVFYTKYTHVFYLNSNPEVNDNDQIE